MSRPLLGGGAAAAVLLSASLLFLTDTSVAVTLGQVSREAGQKGVAAESNTFGADAGRTDGEAVTSGDKNETEAAAANSTPAAVDKQ